MVVVALASWQLLVDEVEVLAAMRETLGDRHPDTLTSINNLGGLLNRPS